MYFGEMPSAMNEFSVGVIFLYKKSARNPSREMRTVVGANKEVPFDSVARAGGGLRLQDILYDP